MEISLNFSPRSLASILSFSARCDFPARTSASQRRGLKEMDNSCSRSAFCPSIASSSSTRSQAPTASSGWSRSKKRSPAATSASIRTSVRGYRSAARSSASGSISLSARSSTERARVPNSLRYICCCSGGRARNRSMIRVDSGLTTRQLSEKSASIWGLFPHTVS